VGVYFIKVDYASRKAIEKIEAKGGKVNVSTNFDRGAVEEPKQKTEETEEQQEPKEKKEPKKSEGKG
ncbi:uL15 family ribosomal protein, partial [Candidatus Woesearchaeota archaeon]|nr:uL15 family ribosomal protein [Candidatus Woesearchaeota archaeon]